MNPYESNVSEEGTKPDRRRSVWFAIAALFCYLAVVIFLNGPTFLVAYLAVPFGATFEIITLLVVAGVCGQLISLCVDRKSSARPSLTRRCSGGLLFGIAFVTFQPRLLPVVSGIILNLAENTPLASIMRTFFIQPYVFIPTMFFAGACSLALELAWQLLVSKDNRRTIQCTPVADGA